MSDAVHQRRTAARASRRRTQPTIPAEAAAPLPASSPLPFNAAPASLRAPVTADTEVAAGRINTGRLPAAIAERLPGWLQWLAIGALIALLYRSLAPRREQLT